MKRIYIDMDDTICDFKNKWWSLFNRETNPYPQSVLGFFTSLEPIDDAIDIVNELSKHYDVWFLTRPSFYNTHCYTEKAEWIKKYFGFEMMKKLILCGDKSLVIGDYLIDDHDADGQPYFNGKWIRFGSKEYPNWKTIKRMLIYPKINELVDELLSFNYIQELLKYSNVYLVGGIVRDALLNKESKDTDIIVEGLNYLQIVELLKPFGKVDIVGQSFSVIKFTPHNSSEVIDIAVPRIDRKIGDGHKGFDIITEGVTIYDDLKRRDFTINSIAVELKTGKILDPYNGLTDLNNKIIKATDANAFIEDPLRILRGIQFASRFKFDIESNTLDLMRKHAKLITEISGERILEELNKIVNKQGDVILALELLQTTNIDIHLLGNKLSNVRNYYDSNIITNNDNVSLFYIICKCANHKHPEIFYKEKLKGDAEMYKNIKVLNETLTTILLTDNIEDIKWCVFNMIQKTPDNFNTLILPNIIKTIFGEMLSNEIPTFKSDLRITGDDIVNKGLKGIEVGKIYDRFIKDALMNKFDWHNRIESITYLDIIINS